MTSPIITTTPPEFFAAGPVRGAGPRRRTLADAIADAVRDRTACAALGGGAYSDRMPRVRIAGRTYAVRVEAGPGGMDPIIGTCPGLPWILATIGEEIAAGRGHVRRPRLKADDWSGWILTDGSLIRVSVRWPDGAEAREVRPLELGHLCSVERVP